MNLQKDIFEFPSFIGEHPSAGIILVPWNYSPCILVAASWCLTHATLNTMQYFKNISMENPYKVITGFTSTSQEHEYKKQTNLGIQAIFNPNPLTVFLLIKVIPRFQRTYFVDYQQLKYNETETVNENCESIYWRLEEQKIGENKFVYKYSLMNQIPCPYNNCHYSETTMCSSVFKETKERGLSATILCNHHFMGFAELGHEDGRSILYHKITKEVIKWIQQYTNKMEDNEIVF